MTNEMEIEAACYEYQVILMSQDLPILSLSKVVVLHDTLI